MAEPRTQQERTAATRAALIGAAKQLFAERGFTAASTTEIVAAAGVTRGALYHHFDDKTDLFRAVYEDVEEGLVEEVLAAADRAGHQPSPRLQAGIDAFLGACLDPEVHQIALVQAPVVLGWEEWKRIDTDYGLGVVRTALSHAMDAGAIAERPVDTLAHTVLGALTDAALYLARSDDPDSVRGELGDIFDRLIAGLAAGP